MTGVYESISSLNLDSFLITQTELDIFMLEKLTANDIQVLTSTEDEFERRGEFERIFPTTNKWAPLAVVVLEALVQRERLTKLNFSVL